MTCSLSLSSILALGALSHLGLSRLSGSQSLRSLLLLSLRIVLSLREFSHLGFQILIHTIQALKLGGVLVLNGGEVFALRNELAKRRGAQEHRNYACRRGLKLIEIASSIRGLLLLLRKLILLKIENLGSLLANLLIKLLYLGGCLLVGSRSLVYLRCKGSKLRSRLGRNRIGSGWRKSKTRRSGKDSRKTGYTRHTRKSTSAQRRGLLIQRHKQIPP